MRHRIKSSIRVKIALIFSGVFLLSCLLSFFITSCVVREYTRDSLEANLEQILDSVNSLAVDTGLSTEQIASIFSNGMYEVFLYDQQQVDALHLTEEQKNKLNGGELVYISDRQGAFHLGMVTAHPGEYFIISINTESSILQPIYMLVFLTLALCLMIGSVLMCFAISFVIKPMGKLTTAARRVAGGDFEARVCYRSDDEIGELVDSFNRMARELGGMEHMRRDFLSNVSHEFKTPIASIRGFAKLLKNPDLSEEERESYLQIIEEESGRLCNLSSNMLKLTKIENQSIAPRKVLFSLDEQIRKVILLFAGRWESKNIEMDIQLDKVDFYGDEELMQQVWVNLIDNAVKFTEENGNIAVYLRQIGTEVIATVADDGVGIPADKQQRIFEKFYQADTSHAAHGNGLGLSIVKSIIDLVGGTIDWQSREGEGARFTIWLSNKPPVVENPSAKRRSGRENVNKK